MTFGWQIVSTGSWKVLEGPERVSTGSWKVLEGPGRSWKGKYGFLEVRSCVRIKHRPKNVVSRPLRMDGPLVSYASSDHVERWFFLPRSAARLRCQSGLGWLDAHTKRARNTIVLAGAMFGTGGRLPGVKRFLMATPVRH